MQIDLAIYHTAVAARFAAVLLGLGLATISPACSPQALETNRSSVAAQMVTLPRSPGSFQLHLGLSCSSTGEPSPGAITLRGCDETLLGASVGLANAADVLVDGAGVDSAFAGSLAVENRLTGKDWEYAVVDVTPAYGKRLTRFRRHLLFVQPDLFVVYDDLAAPTPVLLEYRLRSVGELFRDERSGDLRLDLPKAGLTAHWLTSAKESFQPWGRTVATAGIGPERVLHTVATNRLTELRALTVIIPHCAEQRRGTGFKLLESDTAIGTRVYRDGLPTLLAFRTLETGEANLTGLKFTAPVAVDVFRPKSRRP